MVQFLYGRSEISDFVIDGSLSDPVPLWCGVPQGLVLGPVIFNLYTAPLSRILNQHGILYHKYADDIQLYPTFDPRVTGEHEQAVQRLVHCIQDVRQWMLLHKLKLNGDKTELIYFVSKHNSRKVNFRPVDLGGCSVTPAKNVRNLGVVMDHNLSMVDQVTAICASCNYQLCRLSSIRRYLTTEATKRAVQASIISRIDYCNAMLSGLPNTQIVRLERIQNKAARLITRTPYQDHITPVLRELHWLPVSQRIIFKIMVLVYKCQHDLAPVYVTKLLQP